MSVGKRKRYSKDIKCIFFPDDVKNEVKRVENETSISTISATKSWEKCGDGFLDTPVIKNLWSGKKLRAVRPLAQSSAPVQASALPCDEDPVHIAWSSSESELSDNEAQQQQQQQPLPCSTAVQERRGPRIPAASPYSSIQSYSRALRMLSTGAEDLPTIDSDSDLDDAEDEVEKVESRGEISDCESESYTEELKESPKPPTVTDTDISDYPSDGENTNTVTQSRLESFPLQTGEGSRRSVSDWVRSAQAMLQTPQKQTESHSKTPEDSNKKKRKFQSGGLAERLNRLQCRQRSAISFWRHQSICDTATVDKPGVLVLEVLRIQEESCMQLAQCEQRHPPTTGHHGPPLPTTTTARVLVLFNKETAAQLMPAPKDIIHLYPPWQGLVIEGEHSTIILNTHFSQKVFSDSKQASTSIPRVLIPVAKCIPYSLTRTFGQLGKGKASAEGYDTVKQGSSLQSLCCQGVDVSAGVCDSLLEAIEGLGQAGSVRHDVEVVVQRVYCIPAPDHSAAPLLKSKVSCRSLTEPPLQKGKSRLCVLVQDAYGMFSVVQLHPLPCGERLLPYTRKWEGRACILRGIKVVQRVTRERYTRLFNLIDSLWPPAMPLKVHGNPESCQGDSKPKGPAPSFCYLLSGQEGSVEPVGRQSLSPLYKPPKQQTLRDILQCDLESCRCSFVASVIYKRTQQSQGPEEGQAEVWLVVTDTSLQEEWSEAPCRRTLAVCVTTSCVLTSSVATAISTSTAFRLSFRDVIKENGVILCVDQSVVQLRPPPSECSPEDTASPWSQPLIQPLRLDPLGPVTPPNSLCTLSGVIVGVDEDTACSWPVCHLCGSDRLEMALDRPQAFHCVACGSAVDKPNMKMQLEVLMSCPALSDCTVKVKLHQNTIMSVLNSAACGNEFPGYEVERVLGKEVGPLNIYVRVVTRKPALWMGLEEICL